MRHLRLVLAFLVAPLMTPVVFIAFDLFKGRLILFSQIPFYFATYGLFAYLVTSVLGTAAFFLFRFFNLSNIVLFVVGGALIGFLVSMLIIEDGLTNLFWRRIDERLLCAVAGGLSALVFRVVISNANLGGQPVSS